MKDDRRQDEDIPQFIRTLMPEATEADLQNAHQTVKDYIEIAIRIFERAAREKAERGLKGDDTITTT